MNRTRSKEGNLESVKSEYETAFFNDNIKSLNKFYELILLITNIVPILFIVLTFVKIWIVPYSYSLFLLLYTISISITEFLANKKEKYQIFSMYFGLYTSMLFVLILSLNSLIQISIAYTFIPIISCLYYETKLTKKLSIINYFLVVGTFIIRRNFASITLETYGTKISWIISDIMGFTIQYVFLYSLVKYSALRNYEIITSNLKITDEKNRAFVQMQKQNDEIIEMNKSLSDMNEDLLRTQEGILKFIAEVLGSHDMFTGHHVIHTQKYVEIICLQLVEDGFYTDILTPKTIYQYKTAALLHDIGKIHIPEMVLNKLGKFTGYEFQIMKSHTVESQKLLNYLPKIDEGKFNEIAKQIAYYHHEKWDGKGYPDGISGTDIPLCARIMAAADVLDALISQRLYKDPFTIDEAMQIFIKERDHQFEPCIADAVIKLKNKIIRVDVDCRGSEAMKNKVELEWWKNFHSNYHPSSTTQ